MNLKRFINELFLENPEGGMSILEVVAAAAVLGIGSTAFTLQSQNLNQVHRKVKATFSYNEIAGDVSDAAADFNAVWTSLKKPGTAAVLRHCIAGGVGSPPDCPHGTTTGFNLLRPGTDEIIAGAGAANPVYYDSAGLICTHTDKNNCTIKAYAEITPMCFNSTASCFAAHALAVTVHVLPVVDSPFWLSTQSIPKEVHSEIYIDTNLVPMLQYKSTITCAGRTAIKGISFSLEAVCEPIPGAIIGPPGIQGVPGVPGPDGADGADA